MREPLFGVTHHDGRLREGRCVTAENAERTRRVFDWSAGVGCVNRCLASRIMIGDSGKDDALRHKPPNASEGLSQSSCNDALRQKPPNASYDYDYFLSKVFIFWLVWANCTNRLSRLLLYSASEREDLLYLSS